MKCQFVILSVRSDPMPYVRWYPQSRETPTVRDSHPLGIEAAAPQAALRGCRGVAGLK